MSDLPTDRPLDLAKLAARARASKATRHLTPAPTQRELLALIAVARLGNDAYGARIRAALVDDYGVDVTAGQVYALLRELEIEGCLAASHAENPNPLLRPVVLYRLTRIGTAVLRATQLVYDAGYRDRLADRPRTS